jgi:DNA-binding NarL/FixJ family response regulator
LAPIRILLGALPAPLQGALEPILATQADMEVVGAVTVPVEVLLAAGQTAAHVVLLGLEGRELPGIASHLLDEYPSIKVLAVAADGRRALLYELQPRLVAIGEASPATLVEAIRMAVQSEEAG